MAVAVRSLSGLTLLVAVSLATTALGQQLTPEQQGALLLNSARAAYNEQAYPVSVTRFREYLAKFGNQKDAASARYGLALALLSMPEKDYAGAIEQLRPLVDQKDFADQPYAAYYLGVAQRGLGVRELAQATAKPNEAANHTTIARQRFEEALRSYATAVAAFTNRAAKPNTAEQEWLARSLCDQAELLLRTGKTKEAVALVAPFVADPVLIKTRFRGLGLYYHGFGSFLLHDYQAAGKSLNLLTPFADPVYGLHARYLLARTLQQSEERTEAALHYEAVQKDYERLKAAAIESLKNPAQFAKDPDEKVRLETLAKGPLPDAVSRATFALAVLQYENGNFGDALGRFTTFIQQTPGSPLVSDARLRQGFCQVQLKQYAEAIKTLQPLVDKEPRLADQAVLWIGKAQVAAADPNQPQPFAAALQAAMTSFRTAADRASQLASKDPEAAFRRGEALLELADTQQKATQYREAATTFNQILTDKLLPRREEELLHHQLSALQLAGDYTGSDALCTRFQQQHPKSTLLPAVLFRYAENAWFGVQAGDKDPAIRAKAEEMNKRVDEALKRYTILVEKYPDFPHIGLARFGMSLLLIRQGNYEKAATLLEAIPQAERTGQLAQAPYLLADCLVRLAPTKADDALAAGKMEEQLKAAVEQLDAFLAASPTVAEAPDALLKLGLCHQRLAALIAQPAEKQKSFAAARAAYERLVQQHPKSEFVPQAVFERAKSMGQAGDLNGSMNELRRFTQDPLKAAPVAPMAVVQLAMLLRGQQKYAEAAELLNTCRQAHETTLLADKARAEWVPVVRAIHGLCLKEAGKFADARAVFQQIASQTPNRPEGIEALLRIAQCSIEEGRLKISAARKQLATATLKQPDQQAANTQLAEGLQTVRTAVQHLETQAQQLKGKEQAAETRARMMYDAAWGYRLLAEPEVAAASATAKAALLKQLHDEAAKKAGPGSPAPVIAVTDVPLVQVPLQPSEKKARELYDLLCKELPAVPLATDARFELAELLADRGEHDAALALLNAALDKEPPQELADKIHIRLGTCEAMKGNSKEALAQFDAVAQNPKSVLAGQAQYRAGECLMLQKNWAEAAKRLAIFRDQQPFHNVPGISDKALLRLGQVLAQSGQWDQSRQALELLVQRFSSSPWVNEARYGIGWAWQNQKQFDNAVKVYEQIVSATAEIVAARAQLQIGLCRLEQKRHPEATTALLVVPFSYDYPELNAAALCEAGRAFVESKQPEQAERLFQRVLKEHPDSQWAAAAKERIAALSNGAPNKRTSP